MVNDNLRKGDWYLWHAVKGMILEVNSKNKDTGELYNMKISNIVPGFFDEKYFDINGFKISEIPEGQNCGVPMEGK